MPGFLNRPSNKADPALRRRLITIFTALFLANIGVWLWAFLVLRDQPVLFGTALLAYTFGLRHAVDADHIAAIDNVTRKLMQEGQKPVAVGFFFSLGHSAVVIAMSVAVAVATASVSSRFDSIKAIGGIISTSASALFLFAIAFANLIVLVSVYRTFQRVKGGEPFAAEDFDGLLNELGFLARLFRPLLRMVSKSWHLFPIGVLFGLGFETATEVALFGLSATQVQDGLSLGTIFLFPALFTAGMSLADTMDGALMLGAYGWAFDRPIRKLYYNMTITGISVLVALLIGSIETLGLAQSAFDFGGPFWEGIARLNDNFGILGYAIIGLFMISWVASMLFYRWKRYDELEPQTTSV